jgi:cytochrome c
MVRRAIFAAAFLITVSSCLSFVHPWGNLHNDSGAAVLSGSEVPGEVRTILDQKCADCHSNQTRWPLYSRVAPTSWLVEHDVYAGRSAMNFSSWAGMGAEDRIAALARIAAEVRNGEMPPRPYAMVHGALTESDKQEIAAWSRTERKRIRTATAAHEETK